MTKAAALLLVAPALLAGTGGAGALERGYGTTFDGAWLFGGYTVLPIGDSAAFELDVAGDLAAWTDAEGRLRMANLANGTVRTLEAAGAAATRPRADAGVIVWEARTKSGVQAWMLDDREGAPRLLAPDADASRAPDVAHPWAVLETERGGERDVEAVNLETGVRLTLSDPQEEDRRPAIAGSVVAWRTVRFGVADVAWFDLATGERGLAAADREDDDAPFSDERSILFAKRTPLGREVFAFDAADGRSRATGVKLPAGAVASASRGLLLYATSESGGGGSLAIVDLDTGRGSRISEAIPLTGAPVLEGGRAYAAVRNASGAALLAIDVHPHAYLPAPTLRITSPSEGALVRGTLVVRGSLEDSRAWGMPDWSSILLDGAPATGLAVADRWSASLDVSMLPAGEHVVAVVAGWNGSPGLREEVGFRVSPPAQERSVDADAAGREFHERRVDAVIAAWVESNPAVLLFAGLTVLGVALAIARKRMRRG